MTYGRLSIVFLVVMLAVTPALGASDETTVEDDTAIVYEGDTLTLEAGPERAIRGESDLPAGANLSVALESEDEPRFLKTDSATVSPSGTFRSTFDLSDVPRGTTFEVRVHHDGTLLTKARGTVTECTEHCDASKTTETVRTTPSEYRELAVVETTQGQVANVPVRVGDDDTATLRIGGSNVTYDLTLEVRDGNGDGGVTVRFDTANVGRGPQVAHATNGSDTVSVVNETRVSPDESVLDEGEYPMEVTGNSIGIDPDFGTLLVRNAPADEPGTTTGEANGVGYLNAVSVDSREDHGQYVVRSSSFPELNRSAVTDFGFRPSLEENTFETAPNGTARIPLRTDEIRTATVLIGGGTDDYALMATASDGTGDERVVLLFNRTAATRNATAPALKAADDGDEVSVNVERGSVSADRYRISAYIGPDDAGEVPSESAAYPRLFATATLDVTDANATLPVTSETATTSAAPDFAPSALVALGLASVLAVLGVAFLTGTIEL